ncbi:MULTISPECIES: dihydroorotase [unclassified Synechococcus]|uniref:dihydroorotase n=1 Tax=unclassified Synechococcus TaxID=2626047 RepID=UPI00082DBB2D|nr:MULTISPECIES: dihydroorotase [unclassified Synechococcus]
MAEVPTSLVLRRPDDWHVHLRDGAMLRAVLPATARTFARAIVMPNLRPPVTSVDLAKAYRRRILEALPEGVSFEPLMTAYLTDDLDPDELARGFAQHVFRAAKLYPANATTNSAAGVSDLSRISAVLACMEAIDMPLLIHGEVTDPDVDVFDREALFIERHLKPLRQRHPRLRIVLEHITTEESATYIRDAFQAGDDRIAATITPHHLHLNRNAMFMGGLRSDFYCLPVVKRECHRRALVKAATSGLPCFFLGTDSAPHPRSGKESACGCAGIFNAPHALESYAAVFEQEGALDHLEGFASEHGPHFYGLPLNTETIRLVRREQQVPSRLIPPPSACLGEDPLPDREWPLLFHAGERLAWSIDLIGHPVGI